MGLVTLAEARAHLKPAGTIDDTKIEAQIEEATAIVLDYIKLPYDSYQDTDGGPDEAALTAAPQLRSATLLVLGTLYDNADGTKEPLSTAVKAILHSRRDPTLA